MQPDDAYWRRPADANPPTGESAAPWPEGPNGGRGPTEGPIDPTSPPYPGPAYQGPPPMTPPPSGWRPPSIVEPAPPRRLPAQDQALIDEDEARARNLTHGVGIVVAAILLIVLCALCARLLF